MPNLQRFIFSFVLVLILAACDLRPEESLSVRSITPQEAVALYDESTAANAAIRRHSAQKETILALSGGGSDGAFGAGVLAGWTRSGNRPNFDIVTGVSTGALIAVLAFLGPDYDPALRKLYTETDDADIFKNKGIGAITSDSLYDNAPLKKLIESHVDDKLLDLIAQEHRKGRRLYIGTTNLDAGEFVVWDMGLLASGGAAGRANRVVQFQKIVRASAAVPVFFPPVYIKPKRGVQLRQAHVDGAVKAPVLLSDFLFESKVRQRDLYVIINSSLALEDAHRPIKASISSIAAKAVSGLTNELTHQTVYRGYVRAQNSGTNFHLTSIPDHVPPTEDVIGFDRERMRMLYNLGFQNIQKKDFWRDEPPKIHRHDKVRRRG